MKTYMLLTKPGIIVGNLITTAAGFALASQSFDLTLFFIVLFGLGFVIASACVCNNIIDRENDAKMERTKERALPKKLISLQRAKIIALFLGFVGFTALLLFSNLLAFTAAAIAFVIYVLLYSYWKTSSKYATLVGSIAGALPPVIGYLAVKNSLDLGAALLFIALVLWQMPHFYAIALLHLEDYKKASILTLPLTKGIRATKTQIVLYIFAFTLFSSLFTIFHLTGYTTLYFLITCNSLWLLLSLQGFTTKNQLVWARHMFRFSLITITLFSFFLSFRF